jgi:Amt family ammonium transporter
MFGDGTGVFVYSGFFLSGTDNSPATGADYQGVYSSLDWAGVPLKAKFFFQLAFAGTAATIVSGAVAERIKFLAFFVFSLLLVGISYPITGHWIWGDGFLYDLGFYDFAGSTVVHSVGGWAALIGALLLGPRIGRYQQRPIAMPGHNLSISALGCLILWLGWFGFSVVACCWRGGRRPGMIYVGSLAVPWGCCCCGPLGWRSFRLVYWGLTCCFRC